MKVLLADDHEIVRTGLKGLLESHEMISSVLEVDNGEKALKFIREDAPDLVVLDISMPELSGLDVLARVRDLGIESRILILSMFPERQYALRALRLGAYGYINKSCVNEELHEALDTVLKGHRYVSRDLQDILLDPDADVSKTAPHEKLSDREFKVFLLLAEGKKINEIADLLFISNKTVSTYKSRILEKTGLTNLAEIARYAIKQQLIS